MAFGITRHELTKLGLQAATLVAVLAFSTLILYQIQITAAEEANRHTQQNALIQQWIEGRVVGVENRVESVEDRAAVVPTPRAPVIAPRISVPPAKVVVVPVAPAVEPTPRPMRGGLGAWFGGTDD